MQRDMNPYVTELDLPLNFNFDLNLVNSGRSQHKYSPEGIDQKIHSWLRDHVQLKIHWCELLILPPWKAYPIHVDGEEYDRHDKGKLNFIYGGEGSKMVWFEDTGELDIEINSAGKPRLAPKKTPTEIYSRNVSGFVIANVGILHTVRNLSTPRYCLTTSVVDIHTNKRVGYTELYTRFHDYAK